MKIASYRVKEGDVVEVREKSRQIPMVLETLQNPERDIPDYLNVDLANFKCTFLRTPKYTDVPYPVRMEPHLVVEFYSR